MTNKNEGTKFDSKKDDYTLLPWPVVAKLEAWDYDMYAWTPFGAIATQEVDTLCNIFYDLNYALTKTYSSWAGLRWVVKILGFGAGKYGRNNWMQLENAQVRYTNACLRHYAAYQSGEIHDPETGMPHLAHCLCNLVFLIHFAREEKK
jgi:hypothetical protein